MTFKELIDECFKDSYKTRTPYPTYEEEQANPAQARAKKDVYHKEGRLRREAFRVDLENATDDALNRNVSDKGHKALFDYAWEEGHSESFYRVACIAEEIVDIIKEVTNG